MGGNAPQAAYILGNLRQTDQKAPQAAHILNILVVKFAPQARPILSQSERLGTQGIHPPLFHEIWAKRGVDPLDLS